MEQWLTPDEAAAIARVSKATVLRWLKSGRLRGTKVSHKVWRIRPEDLEAFLATGGSTPAEHAAGSDTTARAQGEPGARPSRT